jgi:outer membrane protein assembly factor BamB
MTDQELIELVREKAAEDLTIKEIREMHARLGESAALREAFGERLEIEQYLADALGRINVPIDEIIQLTGQIEDQPPGASMSIWGGLACLLIGVLLAGGLIAVVVRPGIFDFEALRVAAEDDVEDGEDAAGGKEDEAKTAKSIDEPENKVEPKATDEPLPPNPDPKIELAAEPTPDPKPEPKAPDPPAGPWVATLAAEPKPFAEIAFEDFPIDGKQHPETDVKGWLAPIKGVAGKLTAKELTPRLGDPRKVSGMAITGVVKLLAPWAEGQALRLSLYEPKKFTMHFWNGTDGVTLIRSDAGRATWAAYRSTREAGKPTSATDVLVGTDEDRCRRVERHGGIYDLRLEEGRLVLSRGGIMLLGAPFEGVPQEVYLTGNATIRGASLVRSTGVPEEPKPRPIVLDADKPASLGWIGELVDGTSLHKSDDGGVELTAAENTTLPAWSAVPLPRGGLQEVIFEIENPRPGAGIYLGDEQGAPRFRIGFFHDAKKVRTTLEYLAPGGPRTRESRASNNPHAYPVATLAERHWIKLLLGGGTLKVWVSGDGQHWGRAFDQVINLRGGAHYAGLYTLPGKQSSGVKLCRFQVRRLDAINALAPADILEQAASAHEAADYVAWLAAITEQQPGHLKDAADREAWRRACAINTLAAGPNAALRVELIERLLASRLAETLEVDEKLRLFDQLALVSDTWTDSAALLRVLQRYFDLAETQRKGGQRRAYSTIAHRWMTAPVWTQLAFANPPVPLAVPLMHAELLALAGDEAWQEGWEFCEQLKARGQYHTVSAARWTEAWAARRVPQLVGDDAVLLPAKWRHPLIVEVGKEAFNVVAEFEAALRGKSYRSACRIISSATAKKNLGLLPDRHDPRLLISMRGAVELGMRDHPDLRRTMDTQFGPLGKVRIRSAMSAGDQMLVEAVTVQFYGTEAAGSAHQWLGNRALARGDFNVALDQYRQALQFVDLASRNDVAARRRLAGAMLGRDLGEAVTAPVKFGETEMTAVEFEKLVTEMRTAHVDPSAPASSADELRVPPHAAPAPAEFTAHVRARLDGDLSSDPNTQPDGVDQTKFDWRARQMGIALAANMMYVSNRFQVSAYDLNSGARRWQMSLGADRGRMRDWSLSAMKPLVVGTRIYARRLTPQGPQLVCLEAASGKIVWSTKLQTASASQPRRSIACDPIYLQDQLMAITVQHATRHTSLHLAWFDVETGRLIREEHLIDVRSDWQARPVCEATVANNAILVSLGGGLLCCDSEGEVRWVRKLPWLPREIDASYGYQGYDGPLVDGRRAFFTQPGMRAIECVEIDSGRSVWSRCLSDVRRLIGKVEGVLLAETDRGLVGLDPETGEPLWHHDQSELLDARAWDGSGRLMYAMREKSETPATPWRVALVWLDVATGQEVARSSIAQLQDTAPMFGPFISGNKRLWSFFDRAAGGRTRDLVELVVKGDATTQLTPTRVWTSQVDERMRQATAAVLPRWTLLGGTGLVGPTAATAGHLKQHAGQNDVLALPSPGGKPVWLARQVTVPVGESSASLRIKVARPPNGTAWNLVVRAAGVKLLEMPINPTTTPAGWLEVDVPLAHLAGKTVQLLVGQTGTQGAVPLGYWKRMDVTF